MNIPGWTFLLFCGKIYIVISIFVILLQMIFTNHRKNTITHPSLFHANHRNTQINTRIETRTHPPANPPPPPPPVPDTPVKKPMKWGEPTWFFFHTIAEKVKPEFFNESREDIFDIIRQVCSTLPCPNCAQHATEYMQKIRFQNIRTKEDLQIMLWAFHNEVNKRKGFALFPMEALSEKYSKAMTRNIIQLFLYHHADKHASFRMIADDYFRTRTVSNLKVWFIKNIQIFDE